MTMAPYWEFLDCAGEVPQSRSGHTCALHRNRFLYIFGGFDGANCFDDLYVLDLEARLWRRIDSKGERPSGRASHSAVSDELAGVMYIFGGSGSHFGYTNKRDLSELCYETETWRVLSNPVGETPTARYGQSMVSYQAGLYVWGGTHGTNYPVDMHCFDLCGKQWHYVPTQGELPCGRYRHQAMVKDDIMYMVGGSGINRYGDVFTYHFPTNVWAKLNCTGTDLSDGRYAHSAVLCDGYMYLYGGNDGVRHDDLQQLDLETFVWNRVAVTGECPPGRDFHAAVLRRGSMVIFGGSNGQRRHNDVFEFHMSPKVPLCTLVSDLEALLEQSQVDEATQAVCDVFLTCEDGDSSKGVFCHSLLLRVNCPILYEVVQDAKHLDQEPALESCEVAPPCSTMQAPGQAFADAVEGDDQLDSLFRSVGTQSPKFSCSHRKARRCPPPCWPSHRPHGDCTWVFVELFSTVAILSNFVRYLYTEQAEFGRLTVDQLYQLYLAAKHFAMSRLAALCERHVRVRLDMDNVLPLLKTSSQNGVVAHGILEACKHFFLANYPMCTELKDCEALDPKLLCELMRLHNTRHFPSSAQIRNQPDGIGIGNQSPGGSCNEEVGTWRRNLPGLCASEISVPPETLAANLARLLDEHIEPDFEVVVQGEIIHTHKFVLVARSKYFASCILTSGMVEAQAGRLVIPETSSMTAEAFRTFLRYLYAGDDIISNLAPRTAMYLVDAASFYGLTSQRLKHFCELCVRDAFNESHVLQLFEASSLLHAETVRVMALDFISANFRTVCQQPALEKLDKSLLVEIIKGLAERMQPLPANAGGGSFGSDNVGGFVDALQDLRGV